MNGDSPRILIQNRQLVTAVLSNAPIVVLASNLGQLFATSAAFGPFPNNTIIRARILSAQILAKVGDAAFFSLQAVAMDVSGNTITVPAFVGSSLGLAAFASLQAETNFHIEDLAADMSAPYPNVILEAFALVENTDSGASHQINSMNVTWEVFTTQYDMPLRTPAFG